MLRSPHITLTPFIPHKKCKMKVLEDYLGFVETLACIILIQHQMDYTKSGFVLDFNVFPDFAAAKGPHGVCTT